ncbi:unnamed protein product, partial [Closterium sp. NIES-54]
FPTLVPLLPLFRPLTAPLQAPYGPSPGPLRPLSRPLAALLAAPLQAPTAAPPRLGPARRPAATPPPSRRRAAAAEPPPEPPPELPYSSTASTPAGVPRPYLLTLCDRADGLSLFYLTSGVSPAPPATADSTVRSQWATRDAAARLAVRRHLPTTERVHFIQYRSAQTLYDAVVARYSSPATAALSRLFLPYLSSCEAEIYAGAMAAQELRWLTYLLTDLGEQPRSPPVLYVENKAMLALCREHRLEHRTKHIALRYFLARELQQRGQLRLAYVAS